MATRSEREVVIQGNHCAKHMMAVICDDSLGEQRNESVSE